MFSFYWRISNKYIHCGEGASTPSHVFFCLDPLTMPVADPQSPAKSIDMQKTAPIRQRQNISAVYTIKKKADSICESEIL